MSDDVKLYNPHDGLTGRDGGPYLDQEERRLAEIVRAAKEDREPEFDKAPATAGTPLVTAATLVKIANPTSNPSQENADPYSLAVDTLAESEDFPVNAFSTRQKTDQEKDNEKANEEADIHNNPANATIVSTDDEDTDKETRGVKQERDKTAANDEDSVSSKAQESEEEQAKAPAKSTANESKDSSSESKDSSSEPVLKASRAATSATPSQSAQKK